MKFLLILLVLAAAIAPLLHFAPSKSQRRAAGLREFAALQGLFVEFRRIPVVSEYHQNWVQQHRGQMIYYGLRRLEYSDEPPPRACWLRIGEEWRATERRLPAPAPLLALPPSVLAAGSDQGSCGVYWLEQGAEDDVRQISEVLQQWSALQRQ